MNEEARRAIELAVAPGGAGAWRRVGGSGWGEAWSLSLGRERYFVKTASGAHLGVLDCEADGLRALRESRTVRVPAVACGGVAHDIAYLVLEWLDLRALADASALGRALARLHRAATPCGPRGERFGWHRDNWIGGTLQANAWNARWGAFFAECRLAPQVALARTRGFLARGMQRDAERVLAAMPLLLEGHDPAPSLVHGDLWSGNAAALRGGEPVVFDPAVYVADREVDLAMTQLFGGFAPGFMQGYEAEWPLTAGYPLRRDLYNLYHLLNHLNLFGKSYLARTEGALQRLLAVIGPR